MSVYFRTRTAAYQASRWDLRTHLRDPNFAFNVPHYRQHDQRWHIKSKALERTFNPLLDMIISTRTPRYRNTSHLTAEVVKADPVLLELYKEKVGPLLTAIWEEVYTRRCAGEKGSLFPDGFFADTFQTRINFRLIFQYIAEHPSYMDLTFDRKKRIVPEELQRKNQVAYIAAQLGVPPTAEQGKTGWWNALIRKYCLDKGFEVFYNGSPYALFSDPGNYGWAFRYKFPGGRPIPEGQHLHWGDFSQKNMWKKLNRGSKAWREIDHIVRQHWGVVVYNPETGIDPRLFPENHKQLLADISTRLGKPGKPFANFNALCIGGRLAGVMKKVFYHVGKLLKLRYPEAFIPTPERPEHLRDHWFRKEDKFKTVQEKREALEHEIEVSGIPWHEVPKKCRRPWFRKVFLNALLFQEYKPAALVNIFKECFPEKFKDGTWHEGDFPAVGVRLNKAASFRRVTAHKDWKNCGIAHFDRIRFYLPKEYIGTTIRRASAEHALIYRKSTTFTVKGKRVEWQPAGAFIFGPLAEETKKAGRKICRVPESAFVDLDNPQLPDYKIVNKLSGDLLEAGIMPHSLSMERQKDLVRMYQIDKEKGLSRFIRDHKPRQGGKA